MRLRGTLNRQSKRLYEVVSALHRLHKGKMTFVLSPDSVVIVAVPAGFNDAQAWATLRTMCPDDTGIFSEYKIESQQENRIGFEVEASLLTLALKSSDTGEQTVIKLRKKDGQAVLSFEIITQNQGPMMTVIQDVPIKVLSGAQVEAVQEPQAENPTVRLISPPMKTMSTVVERLKCLADRILLKANMNGELEVGVTSDMAFMTNYWKDLAAPTATNEAAQPRDASKRAEAYVDASLLSKVLTSHQLKPSYSICCIMEGQHKVVVWLLFMGNVDCITYYLPVLEA